MSGACSPGGEPTRMSVEGSPEGRSLLVDVEAMLRSDRIDEARATLENLRDPVLIRDWRINRVREVLAGEPSQPALDEAADLLARTIEETN
ncbi:MAG: hypothetical protein KAW17_10180 [Candidatus Eisenbacteria sp.]|nr:hypothetical protein [Candidatus Eisenbacteria bacterium]